MLSSTSVVKIAYTEIRRVLSGDMFGVSLPRAIIYAALALLPTLVIFGRYPFSTGYQQRPAEAMATTLKFLTVPPRGKHTATVIFMHGLGDSGYGWKPVADQLAQDPSFQHVKWVLPHAPSTPCTANGGISLPGWFDIISFDFKGPEDELGILKSKNEVNKFIEQEINQGIPANRIVVGGFSQGGAMSLVTGLTSAHKLAGLAVMSGWFAIREKVKELLGQHATSIPIFWGHGADDPLVPLSIGKLSKEELKQAGVKEANGPGEPGISFNEYRGLAHSADIQEISDLASWLKNVIPPS